MPEIRHYCKCEGKWHMGTVEDCGVCAELCRKPVPVVPEPIEDAPSVDSEDVEDDRELREESADTNRVSKRRGRA